MGFPLLYEINTRCWLRELSAKTGRLISLKNVPEEQFTFWSRSGFTHIWLMGVWTTGPLARAQALSAAAQDPRYAQALPAWTPADVDGSPYAIAEYQVPPHSGGEEALAAFRKKLHSYGLKLILDFVPNHLGLDHPWLKDRPDLFVQGLPSLPGGFRQETSTGVRWLAHGRDPYFSPWTDTVQLEYRSVETRTAMGDLLLSVARRCDGVRCDMAMLLINEVFSRTWEQHPVIGTRATGEFWENAIAAVRREKNDFLFLAEVYWGLDARLRSQGFDFTYDKPLYDAVFGGNPADVPGRVNSLQESEIAHGAHFLENHDEVRVASRLNFEEHRAAALLILALPGLRFLYEGQLTGARLQCPVQLARRALEPENVDIRNMYEKLLNTLKSSGVGYGSFKRLQPGFAWADNSTSQYLVTLLWQTAKRGFDLVAINFAPHRSQCNVSLPVEGLGESNWTMSDRLGTECYERRGVDMVSQGLFLDLPAHGAQLFHFLPA